MSKETATAPQDYNAPQDHDRAYGTRLTGAARATYVHTMFGRIARRYDLVNRLMTFGMDVGWRRRVVAAAIVPIGGRVLDVATGTGDIAFALAQANPRVEVVGIDFVPDMIATAQERAARKRNRRASPPIVFQVADALNLPFSDNSFDCVTSGFAMRNVTDIGRAFSEMLRVVKPGGRVVCLEITHAPHPLVRFFFGIYFYRIIPLIGGLVSGDREAYTYLPHSLTAFPDADGLRSIMRSSGWTNVLYKRLNMGTVALHVGTKP